MTQSEREKLLYLLKFMDYYIEQSIYEVLSDSADNPEHSAVTTSNLVKCYIEVMGLLGVEVGARNVEQYMQKNCFTADEIRLFLDRKSEESTYYVGKQY